MSLFEGQQVELTIEKPASGGRMIARHLGQIVLVRGAIPGERVLAWIERAEKRMAYAVTREVLDASSDRRVEAVDPLCGGALYSHIKYERQLAIKADIIRDAFTRVGRHPLEAPVAVAGSPEDGYRMRARLHVHGERVGFFREGTHHLCDARITRQLRPETIEAVERLATALDRDAPQCASSITVTENIAADERAAHVELAPTGRVSNETLERAASDAGLRGLSARDFATGKLFGVGTPIVTDPLHAITAGRVAGGTLQRHAESFFQGNRHLLAALVLAVADAVPDAAEVLDLFAGVGLFSVALAALGHSDVMAVEGDRASGADLRKNADAYAPRLRTTTSGVEQFLSTRIDGRAATVIIDPPRTGLSKDGANLLTRMAPPRLVYVSCDPPTLARDARRFLDAGYALESLRAFDLFPNTPHVETLAVFVH
jgi:23S rRNA (uracil1939-C5)-methyltransferase